jgi:beta-glucosidase
MERFVGSVLALMTLDEKVGQLTQSSASETSTGPRVSAADRADIRAGKVGSFLGSSGAERTRELQQVAVEESRLGIPLLFAHDVIHGFRTIFPVPLAEAASFDPDAVERAARIAATEAAAITTPQRCRSARSARSISPHSMLRCAPEPAR